jgi:hypothetical protein
MFNSQSRLGSDQTDATQQNLQNTRFANYMLSSFFSDSASDSHVMFATQQPMMMSSSIVYGGGIIGSAIDVDSNLTIHKQDARELEKLQLMQRPFLTVPYLGRGTCDFSLESQLRQGEMVSEKKSMVPIIDNSFMGYHMYPVDSKMDARMKNPQNLVEEAALDGWTRGGAPSRSAAFDE